MRADRSARAVGRWFPTMRIAQVAPLYEAVPPRLYGGTERIVAHLTDALVARGHEVTLFASGDSDTSARLVPCRTQAIRMDPSLLKSDLGCHLAMIHEVYRRRDEFDIVHFHVDMVHFPFFAGEAERTVTTLHGRLDLDDLPPAYARWADFPLVSISDDQRRPLPDANWVATIPHGLEAESYRFTAAPQRPYLAFLGRISPEKRPEERTPIRGIRSARSAFCFLVDRRRTTCDLLCLWSLRSRGCCLLF